MSCKHFLVNVKGLYPQHMGLLLHRRVTMFTAALATCAPQAAVPYVVIRYASERVQQRGLLNRSPDLTYDRRSPL